MENATAIKQSRFISALNGFLYSVYFPVAVSVWAFLCYALNLQTVGLFVVIAAACFMFVSLCDLTPVIPLFTCFFTMIKDYSLLTTLPYLVAYGVALLSIVLHFIRFSLKTFYLGKLFFPLCLVSAALFFGGVLSNHLDYYAAGLPSAFGVGPAVILIYLLFVNTVRPPKDFDASKYLAASIIIATLCAAIELLFVEYHPDGYYLRRIYNLGWGSFNTYGTMTLIAVPLCCFMIVKTQKFIPFVLIAAFLIVVNYIGGSDGSFGISIFALPFLAVYLMVFSTPKVRKNLTILITFLAVCVCIAGIFVIHTFDSEEIRAFILLKTKDSGRLKLYNKALELFKQNPVFGVGLGFFDESIYKPTNNRFNFHSTFFHIAATMGVFGLIAYAIYFAAEIRIILGANKKFNSALFIAFTLFQGYAVIDICNFNVIPLMGYITLLIAVAEKGNMKAEGVRLPLFYR